MVMLKLKTKAQPLSSSDSPRAASVVSNGASATPGPQSTVPPQVSKPAIKLKINTHSQPSTPAPVPAQVPVVKPKKTKAGRASKPSAKLIESKKRLKDDGGSDDETISVIPRKKVKLSVSQKNLQASAPKTPIVIKPKRKGKLPGRKYGEGYDSEASDREDDPYIEEQFILRMFPGPDCDYLRQVIAEKKLGLPKNQGGADVHMKFFHLEGRRAAITVRGTCYAATLVDLPTITEGMKSWDKRGWWKSADICQMLWVFAHVKNEEEAKHIALPSLVDDNFQYPHGLTAPMHFARKRRFRKRVSRTAIEKVEAEVERLLAEDAQAVSTRYEMIEPDNGEHGFSDGNGEYSEDEDEDAEGEAETPQSGYFNNHQDQAPQASFNEDAEADIEDLWAAEMEEEVNGTPSSAFPAIQSLPNGDTPMAEEAAVEEEDDSGDESLEDDDGDDENGGAEDEGEKARLAHIQSVKEDISDMEKQIEESNRKLAVTQNPILRKRLDDNIRRMKAELQLKISSLGEEDGQD